MPEEKANRKTPERLLRDSLREAANLREFLASALPDEVDKLNFEEVEELPREHFSGDWREREADLLFEIGYGEGVAVVGVLAEHLTESEPFVVVRAFCNLANYLKRKWYQWMKAPPPKPKAKLPPAFSVVLHTNPLHKWGNHDTLHDVLDEPKSFHPFMPDWGPVFWNLAERSIEALLKLGPWMQLMAVMRASNIERTEFERVFAQAVRNIKVVSTVDHVRWSKLFHAIVSHSLFRRPKEEWATVRQIAQRENPTDVKEVDSMFETQADYLERIGEEKGRILEARSTLQEMIKSRCGAVPPMIQHRIDAVEDAAKLREAILELYNGKEIDKLPL